MKRNETKVPGFDEIIFENRNREYGAYDLRKRYKTVASFSVLTAGSLTILLFLLLSLKSPEATAVTNGPTIVILKPDFVPTVQVDQPKPKMPYEIFKPVANVAPEVTTDTTSIPDYIPTVDDLMGMNTNRNVNDTTLTYTPVNDNIVPVEPEPEFFVEEMPMFPGGTEALLRYIAENTSYPSLAEENRIQGRVFLRFVVTSSGKVSRVEVLKGVDPLLDEEAMRVINTLPDFRPGKQNGVAVPVWFSVPVLFKINDR
jgi:periplasmic protein TonB